jgi:predicted transporter
MKNIGNILIGSLSSLGIAAAIPETAQTAVDNSSTVINSVEALISLVTGLLSTFLVAWIKRKWDKQK